MLIANPAYDTVFKHLLQNNKLAKFFIGLLLEVPIIELEIQPQEVTIKGAKERRPDIVLYINGIAIGVLELKKASVSASEGIRQNISNQLHLFNKFENY